MEGDRISESTYLFYLGCLIPYRVPSYEISARKVLSRLDIELKEMPEFNCCGLPVDPINHEMIMALAARNLCLAEREELNILTLCPGCNGTLSKVNSILKKDARARERVNGLLKEDGMEFRGTTEVKHMVQVLAEAVGPEGIRERVVKPLKELKVAEHYGCHIVRPVEYMGFDSSENPTILRSLIEATGATWLDYVNRTECCGYPIISIDEKVPFQLARDKLRHMKEAGAEALVTICPSCYLAFDVNQPRIEKLFNERFELPVLHLPELLALAFGIGPDELALKDHMVKVSKAVERFGGEGVA
ncbi:MAG: CoB--CoM heterodisulfide reductase iron-sulfur subunit B family protein [Candidatus Freyarchaeota archaeon]